MKKTILIVVLMLLGMNIHAQNSGVFKKLANNLSTNLSETQSYDDYNLEGKMFITLRDSADHSERLIIDFQPDNQIAYAEAIIDKDSGDIFTNTFTGDVMRRGNAISVRADRLNGERIGNPQVFNFLLSYDKNQYYLLDINTREKWIDTNFLDEETAKQTESN